MSALWKMTAPIVCILISILIITGYFLRPIPQQKVVVFNKGYAISEFALELERKHVNEGQGQFLIKRFTRAINSILKEQSLKNNWVIVPKNAVYAGAKDKTSLLLKLIARKMKKNDSKVQFPINSNHGTGS